MLESAMTEGIYRKIIIQIRDAEKHHVNRKSQYKDKSLLREIVEAITMERIAADSQDRLDGC
jgi:hypothetical protein